MLRYNITIFDVITSAMYSRCAEAFTAYWYKIVFHQRFTNPRTPCQDNPRIGQIREMGQRKGGVGIWFLVSRVNNALSATHKHPHRHQPFPQEIALLLFDWCPHVWADWENSGPTAYLCPKRKTGVGDSDDTQEFGMTDDCWRWEWSHERRYNQKRAQIRLETKT